MQVPTHKVRDGYVNSFLPPDSLSDDAVRERAASAAASAAAPRAPTLDPTWGPLVPEMNKAPPRPSRKGPGGPAWAPGDRRQLGGFDARFHSTAACGPLPVISTHMHARFNSREDTCAPCFASFGSHTALPLHDHASAISPGCCLELMSKCTCHDHLQHHGMSRLGHHSARKPRGAM